VNGSHPLAARLSSPVVTAEAGWQLLASRGGRRRARRMDPQGPFARVALLCCVGNFVGWSLFCILRSLTQSTVQRRSASTQLSLPQPNSRRLSHAICLHRLLLPLDTAGLLKAPASAAAAATAIRQ